MNRIRFCVFLSLCCFESVAVAQVPALRDTTLFMDDGVRLDAVYALPHLPRPPAGFPAILFVHGFGGSKQVFRTAVQEYAAAGYVTCAYSVRGQGASEGVFDFFTSERLVADLRRMMDVVRTLPGVRSDRIGVYGISQGGVHAWSASAYAMGARCAVAVIATTRFEDAWTGNGCVNYAMGVLLQIATAAVRLDPEFKSIVDAAVQSGQYDSLAAYLRNRSLNRMEAGISTPVLAIAGQYDQLFDAGIVLEQFAEIPSPKRFILQPVAHTDQGATAGQIAFVRRMSERWFDFWLMDNQKEASVACADSALLLFDGERDLPRVVALSDTGRWRTPGPQARLRRWYLSSAGLSESPVTIQAPSLITYINPFGSNILSFRSAAVPRELVILPLRGSAHLVMQSTGAKFQANVLLFDRDTATGALRPITRGQRSRHAYTPNTVDTLDFAMNTVVYTLPAGHMLEAQIHTGMPILPDAAVHFGNSVFGLPVNSITALGYGGDRGTSIELCVEPDGPLSAHADARAVPFPELSVYPNPASGRAVASFVLPRPSTVTLELCSLLGHRVARRVEDELPAGSHNLPIEAAHLRAGVYLVRILTNAGIASRTIVLTR